VRPLQLRDAWGEAMSDLVPLLEESIRQAQAKNVTIGASQIAAILGLDPFKSAAQLYGEMTGVATPSPENENMKRGKHLEPGLCSWWCDVADATRCETRYASRGVVLGNGQLQVLHPQHTWARATPDIVSEAMGVGSEVKQLIATDVKCPSSTRKKIGEAWVDSWSETAQVAPEHYVAQSTFQQGVLRAVGVPVEVGELAAGPSWGRLIRVAVPFDAEFFELMLARAAEFRECVITRRPLPSHFLKPEEQHQ
jgi:hypothetical protein